MRKLIAAMNMTLDGFCDHTVMNADQEVHQHYTDLLRDSGIAIWGRKTFQLMDYWRTVLENPSGDRGMDDFAAAIDDISKVVYSRTLDGVDWRNTELKREIIKNEIEGVKRKSGKPILVGSPSLIVQFGNLGLVDEYQLSIHPTVVGEGLPLFKDIAGRVDLTLIKTKTFGCGAVTHYYEPAAPPQQ